MPEFDLAIRGGTVVTAADTLRAEIGIRDGRIVAVAERVADAARTIDASGLLVLPGGIDSHVHIAQPSGPGIVMADDFASATRAAAAGGNTCVMPFAVQPRGRSLREAVEAYRALAEGQCHVDVAIHLIVSDPTEAVLGQELPALIAAGYTSFKVFMTYDDLVLNDRQILDVFDVARREGARVMVHAEGYDAIRYLSERLEKAGETRPFGHALSRPQAVEREAAHRAISHAELVDLPDRDRPRLGRAGDGADRLGAGARPEDPRRDLPAIPDAHRGRHEGDRRRPDVGCEVRLLAAAAGPREPGGDLVRPATRGVRRGLLRPLPVPLRRR